MKQNKTNIMAAMPMQKLLLVTGLPMVISMVLQAVYNIVDRAFVAGMQEGGEAALNALTLAFPMQMLMVAVGIGTGVGANALLARCLGENDRSRAGFAAGNAIFLGAIIYLVFLLFGLFGAAPYIASQTKNAEIAAMGTRYLTICSVFSFGVIFFAVFEKLLQASGHSLCSTIAQIAGAITNIILDPIMIYGLLGCPKMGVDGAAWATVIGQCISAVLGLVFHFFRNREVPKAFSYLKPSLSTIRAIYLIGLPAMIAQALMSVMTYGLNLIFGTVSEAMVTAYGLYYKLQQFILFAAFGLRDAITPAVAYGYGMKNLTRVRSGIRYGILYTGIVMLAGTLAAECFAQPISRAFGLSGYAESLCISAMRTISISFLFAGVCIALQGVFQAIGGGAETLIIALCRQLVLVLPVAYLLSVWVRAAHVSASLLWVTFPFAECLTMLIGILMMKRKYGILLKEIA